ncbi:MAG TPA: FAD-dependent oxidoreductase [Acidimicrobiales bacterium]|nr:FAD-dependent oxidoreductase [Acidimicrobiales bacterium]
MSGGVDTATPVVVVGGSVAGLATALALGRQGHRVTIVERDPLAEFADAEAAFAAERRGAPQAHQTHGFLARLTVTLRRDFPDIWQSLLDAGAESMTLTRGLGPPEDGDDDLNVLIVRRTTFEWALREAVRLEPSVEYVPGTEVAGLVGSPAVAGGPTVPRITGVRLADGTELPGDVVICTGRRGPLVSWLAGLGGAITEEVADTHIVYLTRWYRLPQGTPTSDVDARLGGNFGYLKYLAVPCDGSTFSVTLAVRSSDDELRKMLLDAGAFDRACRLLPGPDRFMGLGPVEPLGPVRPMGGLINRLRRFTDAGGRPLVTGLHVVGDAHTCTNPMYGRGCALAFVQATLLAQAYAAHGTDARERAATYEALSAREVEPWYHTSVAMDSIGDNDGIPKEPDPMARRFGALVADVMLGNDVDPVVARGLLRMINTLVRPDELMADADFLGRVASYFAAPEADTSEFDSLRVRRRDLLRALAA